MTLFHIWYPACGYNPYGRNIFISKSMSSLVVKRILIILVTYLTKLFKEDITLIACLALFYDFAKH